MALTDTAIRKAKSTNKGYRLYDEKGLYLIVNPNEDTLLGSVHTKFEAL